MELEKRSWSKSDIKETKILVEHIEQVITPLGTLWAMKMSY